MNNPDEFYKEIERGMSGMLSTTGEMENAFWQQVGKSINQDFLFGNTYNACFSLADELFNLDHTKRWEGQNKLTDLEKKVNELARENEQ